MTALVNDRWRAVFTVTELGHYVFTVEGWIDPFETWSRSSPSGSRPARRDARAGGAARLVDGAAARASAPDAGKLAAYASQLRKERPPLRRPSRPSWESSWTGMRIAAVREI